ncbi:MAG: Crp/Fnr family transcriptional regulator [Bacteroidota bacterium]
MDCYKCLKKSRCFKDLTREDFEKIKSNRLQLLFKKGEIICKQGAYASNILYLNEGSAKTYLESSDNKNNIISVLPQGELIGLPSLFSSRVYPYSAAALEDCKVCSFDIRLIEDLIRSNGNFASRLIKCINTSTIQNYDRYIFNTQRPLKGRLADILVHLSEDIYSSEEFKLNLSRMDLAEWTQMAPESVTRILSNFKKEGLIEVDNKQIKILNLEKLRLVSIEE